MYLLDTNICIYIIKQKPKIVLSNLKNQTVEDLMISSITVAKLMYGVEKSQKKEKNRIALTKFLASFKVVPFDERHAEAYGEIRASLESKGNVIGPYDLQIAAQALAENYTLITNNEKEFLRIPDLKVTNWAK